MVELNHEPIPYAIFDIHFERRGSYVFMMAGEKTYAPVAINSLRHCVDYFGHGPVSQMYEELETNYGVVRPTLVVFADPGEYYCESEEDILLAPLNHMLGLMQQTAGVVIPHEHRSYFEQCMEPHWRRASSDHWAPTAPAEFA